MPELIKLTLFGIAFGYIEGAVAFYLRMKYYPQGLAGSLEVVGWNVLMAEMGRELCTLLVLGSVAALTKGPFLRRFGSFVMSFAIWDIFYYIALYLFLGWPANLLEWDVLFLVPTAWFAPVLAPISISILGIAGNLILQYSFEKNAAVRMSIPVYVLLGSAFTLWMVSFICYPNLASFPKNYLWLPYIAGLVCAISALTILFLQNCLSKPKTEAI